MADSEASDRVWMEEDDWCQREVLPLSSMSWCRTEINKSREFAAKHTIETAEPRVPVYSAMYVREDCPAPLSSLGITRMEFDELMRSWGFQRKAVAGFSVPSSLAAYRGSRSGSGRSGKDLQNLPSGVFIDWDQREVIENISVDGPLGPEEEDLMSALQQLGSRYPLLYVDWPWGLLCALDGGPALKQIAGRLEEVRERNRRDYPERRDDSK